MLTFAAVTVSSAVAVTVIVTTSDGTSSPTTTTKPTTLSSSSPITLATTRANYPYFSLLTSSNKCKRSSTTSL